MSQLEPTGEALAQRVQRLEDLMAIHQLVGRHEDVLRRERDGWRFVRRKGYVDLPTAIPRP